MEITRNTKDRTFSVRLRQVFPVSWRDCCVCLGVLAAAAVLCALLRMIDPSDVFVALIFECAVVLVSRFTDGYLFGLLASVIGVIGVNWIFTYPYMQLNFTISGYPLTILVMLLVNVFMYLNINKITVQDRLDGFETALTSAGMPFDREKDLEHGAFNRRAGGYDATMTLLQRNKDDLPTALCAASASMLMGAFAAIRDYGLRVPEDVSVMGVDGLPLSSFLVPRLATVRQTVSMLAKRSVEILLGNIERSAPACHETVPFEILSRESIREISH
mgnify:CR=1 FL=1